MALFRVWPKQIYKPFLPALFVILCFLFPHSMNWSLQLASDHIYLAFLFYFGCILLVQQWALSGFRVSWLLAALIVFFLGLLMYENIALLFPVGFVLAYPLARFTSPEQRRRQLRVAAIVSVISCFLILPVLYTYQVFLIQASQSSVDFVHPAFTDRGILMEIPARILSSLEFLLGYLVNLFDGLSISGAISATILNIACLLIFASVIGFWLYAFSGRLHKQAHPEPGFLTAVRSLCVAAACFIFLGLMPYALWGADANIPHVRFYTLPLFGIVLTLLLGIFVLKQRVARIPFALASVSLLVLGAAEFSLFSNQLISREYLDIHDYASMVEIVPRVEAGTFFLFFDNDLGYGPWTGCSLALRMLYATRDLRCGFFSSSLPGYAGQRMSGHVVTNEGGTFSNGTWILIGRDEQGQRYVIPQVGPDSPYLIEWVDRTPLETDCTRIFSGPPLETEMYLHLKERWSLQAAP